MRRVKSLVVLICVVMMSPAYLLYVLLATVAGKDKVFPGFSQLVALIPGVLGTYMRRGFYRMSAKGCSDLAFVCFGTVFSHPGFELHSNCYIGPFCSIGKVTVGADVLIGSHVCIMNGSKQHQFERLDIPIRLQPGEFPRTHIGEDSWIGDGAIVMADVGCHCVVGAGSVVVKPLPDFAIAVGNPARILRYRNDDAQEAAS